MTEFERTSTPSKRVTFIGLGAMGVPMAQNIKRAGYHLTVYNRDQEKATPFREQGVAVAATPAEAVKDADFVITMLADDKAVQQVMLGEGASFEAMRPDSVYINMSTISPSLGRTLAGEGKRYTIHVLSAPVAGSVQPATEGTLVILVDGAKEIVERAEPLLKTMGKTIHYLGEPGNALLMKLLLNGYIQVQLAAFAELLTLGKRSGLDKRQVIEILTGGAAASPFIKLKANNVLNEDYTPAFSLKLTRKDIGLVAQEFIRTKTPGPVIAAAEQLYSQALNRGRGDEDMSVIVPLVENLAGLEEASV